MVTIQIAPVASFTVDTAIQYFMAATDEYAEARFHEQALDAGRHKAKEAAIRRLMDTADPTKEGKLYSATAAEKIVEQDEQYYNYLLDQAHAAVNTIVARSKMDAARIIAETLATGARATRP